MAGGSWEPWWPARPSPSRGAPCPPAAGACTALPGLGCCCRVVSVLLRSACWLIWGLSDLPETPPSPLLLPQLLSVASSPTRTLGFVEVGILPHSLVVDAVPGVWDLLSGCPVEFCGEILGHWTGELAAPPSSVAVTLWKQRLSAVRRLATMASVLWDSFQEGRKSHSRLH